jgi:YHS domain-containing protein
MFVLLFRLLFLFFAVSVIRSVVSAVVRAFRGTDLPQQKAAQQKTPADGASGGNASGGNASASTLLHQDPVCGTYVAAGSSFHKISKGRVLHFCSEECRDRYAA